MIGRLEGIKMGDRMFPPVGPNRADELAAGDTSVDTGGEFTKPPCFQRGQPHKIMGSERW
jgi:hypothetical protein